MINPKKILVGTLSFAVFIQTAVFAFLISPTPVKANGLDVSPGDVIINEIMANPTDPIPSDTNGEWFELFNRSSQTININGWTISDNGTTDSHVISNGGTLNIAPGGFLVLARNGNSSLNGGVIADYDYSGFILGNGDDEIVLTKPNGEGEEGTEIDRVEYDGIGDFPAVQSGKSLSLRQPVLNNDDGINWFVENLQTYGLGDFGSPHEPNIDNIPPTSNIIFPLEGQFYNSDPTSWTGIISGTAADVPSTGISEVKVQIKRTVDNFTWNGSEFTAGDNWNLSTSLSDLDGNKIYNWTYDFPATNFVSDGQYAVYSQAKDGALNSESTNAVTFAYDNTAPTGGSIIINNNDTYTTSREVTLTLSAIDQNLDKVLLSETCDPLSFTDGRPFAPEISYTIQSSGDGNKTVCAKFKDKAGNQTSEAVNDSIFLDTASPSQSTIESSPDGQTLKEGTGFTLEGTAEKGSTINIYIFSEPIVRQAFADDITGKWSITITDLFSAGEHYIEIEVVDKAGNKSPRIKIADFKVEVPQVFIPRPTPSIILVPVEVAQAVAEEAPAEEVKLEAPKKEEVVTAAPEGQIKAEEEQRGRDWTRVLVTLAILIIAAGVGTGGWYGYQWWMQGATVKKPSPFEKPHKKIEKIEPPEDTERKSRW